MGQICLQSVFIFKSIIGTQLADCMSQGVGPETQKPRRPNVFISAIRMIMPPHGKLVEVGQTSARTYDGPCSFSGSVNSRLCDLGGKTMGGAG